MSALAVRHGVRHGLPWLAIISTTLLVSQYQNTVIT
jgi:hypothetical protein